MSLKTMLITLVSRLLCLFFRQRPLKQDPQTIIVIKPCCLGDVILATAAIAALKERYPQADVDVAVGQWSQAALQNNPNIRHLLDSGRVGQGRYSFADLWFLVQRLRQNRYDLALICMRSPIVGLIPWLAGIQCRIGLNSHGRGFAHTLRVPVSDIPRHEALIYLDCVAAMGLITMEQGISKFWTEFHPAEHDIINPPVINQTPFIIIHPSGGKNPGMHMLDKRWPSDRMAALADLLHQDGFHIVLSGVAEDIPLCQEIAAKMTSVPPQIVAGKINLSQFGSLCRQAALFVGGDTGAMHIAVASRCKTVAIFGPSDPNRYAPFAPLSQARFLWHETELPQGGVGQGRVVGFNWADGVTVDEALAECRNLLLEK